jgi:hypothetical protein
MTTCLAKDCDKEAVRAGRCAEHPPRSIVPQKNVRLGHDRPSHVLGRMFPGGLRSVRTVLVESLAVAVGDICANAITDALDAYLDADPADRLPTFQCLPSNPGIELEKAIKERDEAIKQRDEALAKKSGQRDLARGTSKASRTTRKQPSPLRVRRAPPMPGEGG